MTDGRLKYECSPHNQGGMRSIAPLDAEARRLHVVTTTSNPTTGPSTPTTIRTLSFEKSMTADGKTAGEIIPPTRPSSTPFPLQLLRPANRRLDEDLANLDAEPHRLSSRRSRLCDLPNEIHECILDYLFGVRRSASTKQPSNKSKIIRNWATVLRHSRRREVSELALVSKKWRALVQDRLYRHLKIIGTRECIGNSTLWFFQHPHLCIYVKHIEIWFPVFSQKATPPNRTQHLSSLLADSSSPTRVSQQHLAGTASYQSPTSNCTLEEIFRFIQFTFAETCVLTLEGGERRKPPMVQHFLPGRATPQPLPSLPTVRTLVCKSQWNLIRSNEDFQTIANALPNLNEWQGSYAKPKSKTYLSMATIFPKLPFNLTQVNICLEADYRREAVSPLFFRKVSSNTHFCLEMAKAIPTLESFGYTGRVCHSFFDSAAQLSDPRSSRLRSIDIVVKNICRPQHQWNNGSGTTDMGFILAFEALVLAAIRASRRLTAMTFLRIRFIDLDTQSPPPNPYFQLEDDMCMGLWSERIAAGLLRDRPIASFVKNPPVTSEVEDGQATKPPARSNMRPTFIKVSSYASLTSGITIT